MDKITKTLLQIQNLELTIHENRIIHKRDRENHVYKDLTATIERLKKKVPAEILIRYEQIAKRYDVCIIPMLNSTCTGCFIKLPVADANQVKSTSRIGVCPNCGRILFFEEQSTSQIIESNVKGIARFSAPNLMFPDIEAKDKFQAITCIGKHICATGHVENSKEFIKTLTKREELLSTAVGKGIAFPHARGNFARGLTFSIGLVKQGIDFGDGENINIIVVSAVPTQVNKFYLEVVAKLAKYFNKDTSLQRMLNCDSAKQMWAIIARLGM